MKRPKPERMGPVVARVKRGPKDDRWYWEARWWDGETRRPVWCGWATVPEVQRAIAELVARDDLEAPPTLDSCETVTDLLECFVGAVEDEVERGDVTPATLKNTRNAARKILPLLGDHQLQRLDVRDLEAFVSARRRDAAAPATVHMEVKVLRRAWKWGRKRGLTPERDLPELRDLHLRPEPVRPKFTPTDAQIGAVLDQLHGWSRLALLLLFGTGARISEVATLRWAAVSVEACTLTLDGKRKARDRAPRVRVVPILRELADELAAWRPGDAGADDFVLGVSPKVVRSHLSGKHLARACAAAGVPKFTPHGVRRAAVDTFLRGGIDIGTAAAHFGHSPQVMLEHYRQATLEDKRKAVQRVALGRAPAGTVLEFPMAAVGTGRGDRPQAPKGKAPSDRSQTGPSGAPKRSTTPPDSTDES